jgi:hypothetical protein
MDNFTAIRNGLREHIKQGKMPPFELGVYTFLHMNCDYGTGVYQGCAMTIACNFGDPKLKEHVQKSLRRLREKGYINFRKGDGKRHSYPILIDKYDVAVGEQSGKRLNAWKYGDLVRPDYDYQNGRGTVVARKDHGRETVVAPIQDLKTLQDVKDSKTKPSSGAVTPSLPDWLPSESWQGFTEMRQRMNAKAWTSRAMTLTLNKLGELRAQGNDPAAVLDQSVMKGWKSVFPLKEEHQHNGTNGNSKCQRIQNNVASAVRDAARLSEQRRGTP